MPSDNPRAPTRLPNRRVRLRPFMAGDRADQPLRIRLYLTPGYPEGVSKAELMGVEPVVQHETMLIWFLANYEEARGEFFGFAEAQEVSQTAVRYDGTVLHDGSVQYGGQPLLYGGNAHAYGSYPQLRVGGFDQAPMFEGGEASELLGKEFGEAVGADTVAEIAAALPGLWMLRADEPAPDQSSGPNGLIAAIDRLTDALKELPTRSVNRLHNQPPDAIEDDDEPTALTVEEKDKALRATADMRLAVSSGDYSLATEVWETVRPVISRVGAAVARYAQKYLEGVASESAKATIAAIGGIILHSVGILDTSATITVSLAALAAMHGKSGNST